MNELEDRPTVLDDQRNVTRPDLTRLRYTYRPAGVLEWDGRHVPYRARWQAIWRDDHQDVLRSWYPDAEKDCT